MIMSNNTLLVITLPPDLWTVLLGNILTQVSRRHLIKGTAAARGSESQALQAWSSSAHDAATETHLVSTLEGNVPSVLGPPSSGPVQTGPLSSIQGCGSVCISDGLDSLCLRGSVGDPEANVGFSV